MKRTKKIITTAGLAALIGGGVTTVALAQQDDGTPDLDRAAAAAAAEVGDGTVTGVEQDDGGYDVEIRRPDGREVDVDLGADFAIVRTENDDDRDDRDDRDGDRVLDEAARTSAADAALASVGEGTVVGIEADDGGYDVEIRRADGTEVDVDLDAEFTVVHTENDDDDD